MNVPAHRLARSTATRSATPPMPFVNVLPHRHEHEDDDVIVAREGLLDLALFGEVEHIAGHMRL